MEFEEQEFADINTFSLAWRWTDAKHWMATGSELERIRPLFPAIALRLWNEIFQMTFGEESDARAFFTTDAIEYRTDRDPTYVTQWLNSLSSNQSGQIIIFWEPDKAVVTEQNLFAHHWDDFCYPSSDDIVIWPIDVSWVLIYGHEEVFRFKKV